MIANICFLLRKPCCKLQARCSHIAGSSGPHCPSPSRCCVQRAQTGRMSRCLRRWVNNFHVLSCKATCFAPAMTWMVALEMSIFLLILATLQCSPSPSFLQELYVRLRWHLVYTIPVSSTQQGCSALELTITTCWAHLRTHDRILSRWEFPRTRLW